MRLVICELASVLVHTADAEAEAGAAAERVVAPMAPDDPARTALKSLARDREWASRLSGAVQVRAGATGFVAACAAEGRVGVVTRLPRRAAEGLVSRAGLEALLAFVWCADDRAADGAAAVTRAIAEGRARWSVAGRPGHPAPRVAVLADAREWLAAARAAGARAIAVPDAPPGVTPDAVWASFQGRRPSDLDGDA